MTTFGRCCFDAPFAAPTSAELQGHIALRLGFESLYDFREFRSWLAKQRGPTDVRRLDAATLCGFRTARCVTHTANGRAKRPASVDMVKRSLRASFRYFADAGVFARNPTRVLKCRRDYRVPDVPSDIERERPPGVLGNTDGWRGMREAAILALLLGTGMRLASLVDSPPQARYL